MTTERVEIECITSKWTDGKMGKREKYQFNKRLRSERNKKKQRKSYENCIVKWISNVSLITINVDKVTTDISQFG